MIKPYTQSVRIRAAMLFLLVQIPLGAALGDGITVKVGNSKPGPLPPAELIDLANPAGAAIVRHEIAASLEPSTGEIQVSDRMTVVHAPGTPIDREFSFLLWKGLEVAAVESDLAKEVGRIDHLHRDRMKPRAFWKRPPYDELSGYENARQIDLFLSDGAVTTWPETLQVTIRYEGVLADSLHAPEAAYARSFETTAGLITNEGVYLASSSFWIPSRPNDIFTFELRTDLPKGWKSVSQGAMRLSVDRNERHLNQWVCRYPMEEVYLVAGLWEEHHLRHDDVMAQTFTYADTDSSIYNRYLRGTAKYLDLYEERFGPYPFEKFALVENFWQTGYGMPSFTLLGDRVIRLPFILDTSYGHEILHNWWGNGVFVASEEGNWCEGLTTYGADYLYKENESAAAGRQYRLTALKGYLDYVSAGEEIPLTKFRQRHDFSSQAIGYSKSMMVFHQLRRAVGDKQFTRGMQDFYHDQLWRRASWTDLLESVASQIDYLDEEERESWVRSMRTQWIERVGAPELTLEDANRHQDGDGNWRVDLTLRQRDPIAGESESDPFSIQVPVRLTSAEGELREIEVSVEDWTRRESIVTEFAPARVEVDPDYHVLRRLHREEIPTSLSQVLGADTVAIVIADGLRPDFEEAYRELAQAWAGSQPMSVHTESSLGGAVPECSVWMFGVGKLARELAASHASITLPKFLGGANPNWLIDGQTFEPERNVVIAGDAGAGRAWCVLSIAAPADVAVVGRKIPHYGKYSYLVFDAGANVGKGVWPVGESPLSTNFEKGE